MKELFLGYFIDMSTVHLNEKIESSRETIEGKKATVYAILATLSFFR